MKIRRVIARAPGAAGFLTLALAATLGACGNLTAGGVGEARVALSGDAPESSPSQSAYAQEPQPSTVSSSSTGPSSSPTGPAAGGPAAALVAGPPSPSDHDDSPEGEVEAEFEIFLVAEDGDLVALTDGEVRVRVDLRGVEEPEVASRVVAAATYTGLRIVFTEIEAEVDAGLIIGGVPVVGPIDVELEGAALTVTKPLSFVIESDAVADLLIDLNAAAWLQAVDPVALTVDAQVFADLVSVRVR